MKCQRCPSPATVHLTEMRGGKKREIHLCAACAESQHVVVEKPQFDLEKILNHLIAANVGELTGELAKLACPVCGMKYMEFRAEGRLGCPSDYQVFAKGLNPLLEKIHGTARHTGKTPRRWNRGADCHRADLIRLRRELRQAVAREAYEEAARLRDTIRQKEAAP